MKIALDPGHGGMFSGAIGILPERLLEKNVTLSICRKLAQFLRSNGHRAILTRTDDSQLAPQLSDDLAKRAEIANKAMAELFVSVHCNAFTDQYPEGMETWYQPESAASLELATLVQGSLGERFPDHVNRGLKPKNLLLFRQLNVPACHVETEFITNPAQLDFLAAESNHDKLAQAIGAGILKLISQQQGKTKKRR